MREIANTPCEICASMRETEGPHDCYQGPSCVLTPSMDDVFQLFMARYYGDPTYVHRCMDEAIIVLLPDSV